MGIELFARRPETGEAIWAYQISPHDLHDYDGVNENILLDLNIGGKTRKTLAHPDRDGYMYLMDRTNGEILSAQTFGYVNTSQGVDLKTGELKLNPDKTNRLQHHSGRLPCASRSEGLDTVGVLAQYRPHLHTA